MGTDPDNISQPVDPEKRIYDYDPIGNRNSATEGSESKSYAANGLNQYDEITTGGTTEALTYDVDGNLTVIPAQAGIQASGGQMVLSYNAENRLVSVEPASPVDGDAKIEYVYDYMGRRVKKTVYDYSAGSWNLEKELLFVYDGWNLVEEITVVGATETSRYFVWGLDLSQSLQGAGGIGGLLATVDGADTYYFAYDGNGNVGQVIDASSGTIAASYQYDPFGNLIKSEGAYADDNPFRFSTKYHDDETGLVYFGYRYYEPELGRWINRDPIEEEGGLNLYIFCFNSSINFYDPFGLEWVDGEWIYPDPIIKPHDPDKLTALDLICPLLTPIMVKGFKDEMVARFRMAYNREMWKCLQHFLNFVTQCSENSKKYCDWCSDWSGTNRLDSCWDCGKFRLIKCNYNAKLFENLANDYSKKRAFIDNYRFSSNRDKVFEYYKNKVNFKEVDTFWPSEL